jgi:hypothetical protein
MTGRTFFQHGTSLKRRVLATGGLCDLQGARKKPRGLDHPAIPAGPLRVSRPVHRRMPCVLTRAHQPLIKAKSDQGKGFVGPLREARPGWKELIDGSARRARF